MTHVHPLHHLNTICIKFKRNKLLVTQISTILYEILPGQQSDWLELNNTSSEAYRSAIT